MQTKQMMQLWNEVMERNRREYCSGIETFYECWVCKGYLLRKEEIHALNKKKYLEMED